MRTLALLLAIVLAAPAEAQTTRLRGRVMDLDGQPVRDVRIRILDHGEPELFDSGEFQLQLAGAPARVEVQVLDSALQLLYPPRGVVAVPRNPEERVAIVVDRRERDYIGDAIAARLVQLEQLLESNGVRYNASVDSLGAGMRRIVELLEIKDADVQRSLEQQRRQGELKPELLRTVDAYLFELKNLHQAFRLVVPYAAKDRTAVLALRDAMVKYNEALAPLKTNRDAFRSGVRSHWAAERSEGLYRDLDDVYVQALDDIHQGYVKPLNESLLVLQRAHTSSKPGGQEIRAAVASAETAARALDARIPVLETRARMLREALERN